MNDFTIKYSISKTKVKKLIETTLNQYAIPAIAVSLMSQNDIFLQEIDGIRDFKSGDKVTKDDFFHIGSCSKSVLALIAAKLVEQKQVTWSTKFLDVYPEFTKYSRAEYSNITLEDLLLCEAGIQPFTSGDEELPEYVFDTESSRKNFLLHLLKQPPNSKPRLGKFEHLYSNASYTLASAMLEKLSACDY